MNSLLRLFLNIFKEDESGSDGPPKSSDEIGRWRRALADFGFPFRIVTHDDAMDAFETELTLGTAEGFTPVFIVPGLWSSTAIAAAKRIAKAQRQTGGIGAEAGRAYLAARFAQLARDREADPDCIAPALFDTLDPVPPPPAHRGLLLLKRYDPSTRALEPVPEVAIMRIPTAHRHTIPLYLDWGGWNAVPAPAEIAAVALHWQQAYGARLLAIGSDRLEFAVSRRPASHAEAIVLLKEQFVFAPDNWENDRSMLEDAAAHLQVADSWVFWWD